MGLLGPTIAYVSAGDDCTVHIGYPHPYGTQDDEAWLANLVVRHGGRFSSGVMESAPQQRRATFPTVAVAHAFVDELTRSGQWRAQAPRLTRYQCPVRVRLRDRLREVDTFGSRASTVTSGWRRCRLPRQPGAGRPDPARVVMSGLLIGYARVSTEEQDLTAQRHGLAELGVDGERVYVDHGLTGTNRDRPGLREALAACRSGDTLVVTKLDRLARSLPDARAIAEDLTKRKVRLSLGGSVYDPTDPVGRLLFNVLAMVAEFEADLIRSRTREGMRVAKAKGHLRGKQPKLNPRQEAHLVELLGSGDYTTAEVGDLFGVARSTVYRAVERSRRPKAGARPPTQPPATSTRAADAQGRPGGADGQPAAETPAVVYRPRHDAPGLLPAQAHRKPPRARPVNAPPTAG